MLSYSFIRQRFFQGTILVAIIVFILNSVVFPSKFKAHDSNGVRNLKVMDYDCNKVSAHITGPPELYEVVYRNPFWQVHRSHVHSNCSIDKNFILKATDDQNACMHRSDEYEEVVVYNSFYDDRTTYVNNKWVRILAVEKLVPKPRKPYCQVWLKSTGNTSLSLSDLHQNTTKKVKTRGRKAISDVVLVKLNDESTSSDTPSWLAEMPALIHSTGRDHHFLNISYGQRLFSCPLKDIDSTLTPTHVSLAFERGERSTIFLPVEYPRKYTGVRKETFSGAQNHSIYEHEFVICVTQAYGHLKPLEIIEWVELHSLLGVTKINIYNGSMVPDPSLESVFQHYVKTGLLSLHSIPPVLANQKNPVEATKLSSPASLNDCMMRYTNTARWIIVVDFDEVILPIKADNYSALMNEIKNFESQLPTSKPKNRGKRENRNSKLSDVKSTPLSRTITPIHLLSKHSSRAKQIQSKKTPLEQSKVLQNSNASVSEESKNVSEFKHHTYLFLMAYFFRNYSDSVHPSKRSSLLTSRFPWRSKVNAPGIGWKSIVDPRYCLSVFNHYCYRTLSEKAENRLVVQPKFAIVRHYRNKCSLPQCVNMEKEKVLDSNVKRFEDRLYKRVEMAKKEIYS